jgi:hypothetical protein
VLGFRARVQDFICLWIKLWSIILRKRLKASHPSEIFYSLLI